MTDPAPGIDFANLPAPAEGILVTLFITVRKVARSRDFYARVLGGTVVLDENPCMVKLSNSWIIMNPGGPPTPDKPGISVVDYQPGNTTSIFLNLRVADIQACYEEWKAKGAEFVTPPIDRGAEIRCYMRTRTDTSSRSASPPACCTASSPQSARRTSLAELGQRPGNSGQQATIRQPQVAPQVLGRVKDQPRPIRQGSSGPGTLEGSATTERNAGMLLLHPRPAPPLRSSSWLLLRAAARRPGRGRRRPPQA
jgi:predicted enzyme related to lactoylglutathione lyase